jgi:hypothetical protein
MADPFSKEAQIAEARLGLKTTWVDALRAVRDRGWPLFRPAVQPQSPSAGVLAMSVLMAAANPKPRPEVSRAVPALAFRRGGGPEDMEGHIAQLKKNCRPKDLRCHRKQRQALLHWAYDSRGF